MLARRGHAYLGAACCQSDFACSGVYQLPNLAPSFLTPLTRRIAAAKSALRSHTSSDKSPSIYELFMKPLGPVPVTPQSAGWRQFGQVTPIEAMPQAGPIPYARTLHYVRNMQGYDFRRVSFTALIPAFARSDYTSIPGAKEMLAFLRSRGATLSDGPWSEGAARAFAPVFEARFRTVSRVVAEKGATQVLELAAGLSPRGIDLARQGIVYVETDLAESMTRKREIVTAILGAVPENLHLCTASAIDRSQLLECCLPFVTGRPVAVTAEGLLRYLTFDEKALVARNVHEILRRYGGWWITPDVHLRSLTQRQTTEYL